MLRIERYNGDERERWDTFVRGSRNGTFLFCRDYMDYHRDRFADHSLLFVDDRDRLVAVMPCNEVGTTFYSHQGLTYGGFVLAPTTHAFQVKEMFALTVSYLRERGFKEWVYKPVPTVYHRMPSEEDEYFLWLNNARLAECNLASAVDYGSCQRLAPEYCRRNAVSRLSRQGVTLKIGAELTDYWPVLERRLKEKYGAAPVHTLEEMRRLQRSFPDNIICCTAQDGDGQTLAGVVLYDTGQTIHVQYSAATDEGQRLGAQDFLYASLVSHYDNSPTVRYFDFGTSNEDAGRTLNTSLNRYKEGFGARGVAYKKFVLRL